MLEPAVDVSVCRVDPLDMVLDTESDRLVSSASLFTTARLLNCEVLSDLHTHLSHFSEVQKQDVKAIITFASLFWDHS